MDLNWDSICMSFSDKSNNSNEIPIIPQESTLNDTNTNNEQLLSEVNIADSNNDTELLNEVDVVSLLEGSEIDVINDDNCTTLLMLSENSSDNKIQLTKCNNLIPDRCNNELNVRECSEIDVIGIDNNIVEPLFQSSKVHVDDVNLSQDTNTVDVHLTGSSNVVYSSSDTVQEEINSTDQFFDYNFDTSPQLLVETRYSNQDNYYRGCKWSPDGTCVLTCNNDNFLRLYNMPNELYISIPDSKLPDMTPVIAINEGELVYDYCWFPEMSSYDSNTCCFASCSKGSPIHLYDAYDGHLRCSYLAFNHLDEVVSPFSLCFNCDGLKLYSGHKNCIRIFDTTRPGQKCQTRNLSAKGKTESVPRGIVSCIAMNPTLIGNYVVGSYSGSITLFAESAKGPLCTMYLSKCGVSHIMYSPCGNYFYVGERKNGDITQLDVRNLDMTVNQFQRTVTTNQRIYFDISRNGKWLTTANTDGLIKFFDISKPNHTDNTYYQYTAHDDVVNGCSLHPLLPLLATSSGQWKSRTCEDTETFDNSFKLWSLLGQTSYFN